MVGTRDASPLLERSVEMKLDVLICWDGPGSQGIRA